MKRNYEADIIQALKQKPRDGIALQKDLHIRADRTYYILKEMQDNGAIHWDSKEQVWQVS